MTPPFPERDTPLRWGVPHPLYVHGGGARPSISALLQIFNCGAQRAGNRDLELPIQHTVIRGPAVDALDRFLIPAPESLWSSARLS
jgi:hypothetical protein